MVAIFFNDQKSYKYYSIHAQLIFVDVVVVRFV